MPPLFSTNPTLSQIFNAAFVLRLLPELVSSFIHRTAPNAKVNDRFSSLILIACIYLGLFAAYALAFAAPQFAILSHRTLLFAIGIFLILAGTAFRWYSISVLGKFFTRVVATQPGQSVMDTGPYHWIWHPS
jgi:protein-S-isoprenylcysteine O-methyltransferase Ste14